MSSKIVIGKFEKKIIKKIISLEKNLEKEFFLLIIEGFMKNIIEGYQGKIFFSKKGILYKESKLKKIKGIGKTRRVVISRLNRIKKLIEYLEKENYIRFQVSGKLLSSTTSKYLAEKEDGNELKQLDLEEDINTFYLDYIMKYFYDDSLEVISEEKFILTEGDRYKRETNNQIMITLLSIVATAIITFGVAKIVPVTITYKESNVYPYYNIGSLEIKYVVSNGLRIRKKSTKNSKTLYLLKSGEMIRVGKLKGEWQQVYYYKDSKLYTGWVNSKYLSD